jgi:hypothetical protein
VPLLTERNLTFMRPRALFSISLVVVVVSVLAAGCGGSSTPPATTTTTPTAGGALAYARCMRSHGVAGFPDPTGGNNKLAIVSALKAVGDSQAQASTAACEHVNDGTPGTGPSATQSQARTSALLAFARCMRQRGLANFPDPTPSGQLTQEMLADAGINLHQIAVVHAADACARVTHGVITKATVAHFVAGQ